MASGSLDRSTFEPWSQLEGKIVMVTGASSGLGLEFCLDLAKAGCRVVAAARRIEKLDSLCQQINHEMEYSDAIYGGAHQAIAVELDLTADSTAIEASVRKAWDAFGHIDALINNAGVRGSIKSSLNLSDDEWNHVVKTNLTGSWLVAKCVGKRMRDAARGGSIINISSVSGLNRMQVPGAVAYSSSKAGLHLTTMVMALELGNYKIRVNAIAPGLFKSEITGDLLEKKWMKNVTERTVPLRVLGTTDPALTSLVRYLVHDSSNYVSGNIFIVDSGYTLPGFPIFSSL
ncbi:hypothetical protein ABFS82_11G014500 [Erythranthe guttata]|uniref:3-oxoacyl-[acyl-carrier-protein] reductase n=1 Tax=Erythranthe guttata TaxID=4155 RepID=A0A022Q2Q0_ERYGU|nr:PREDICTED: 3-oxoacyl-[acyl-carrier-protein] reductase, chloroplastic-like [Erythranthe guttata]EYU20810.1 hypothetical protein MIMGU_mgv1a011271mg [Erythranthe guttata]|eukprot:XP_012857306.1 PREDICTED: 3-oxoacyl-[acyl-carrier-protein] reductase, chloroplastic-like [Erythranthe guttata]